MQRAEAGFTLLELVVALAIFATAAMALLNLAGQNTTVADRLEQRAFALVAVENEAVAAALLPIEALAPTQGEVNINGRALRWERRVTPTADASLVRVEIDVREGDAPKVIAGLVLFRASQ